MEFDGGEAKMRNRSTERYRPGTMVTVHAEVI
jgi:hypothetical protein